MDVLGLHHVAIAVEDLDDAIATYGRLCGATVELRDRIESQGVEAAGADVIDSEPRPGLGGHEVSFVHPDSTHGVLVEVLSHD